MTSPCPRAEIDEDGILAGSKDFTFAEERSSARGMLLPVPRVNGPCRTFRLRA
jgi:hypothetical protein